jgi:hypothetical protein
VPTVNGIAVSSQALAGVEIGWTEQNALVHELNQITPRGSAIPGRSQMNASGLADITVAPRANQTEWLIIPANSSDAPRYVDVH